MNLEAKLKGIVETVDVADVLTAPIIRSIENLMRTAASTMESDEASVIVRDGDSGDLRFLVAIGEVADKLLGLKIPSGKGIAGFVFSSGQPMAVADVGQEESFYAEVDKHTGYSTQTILATPLRLEGEVIGVLEFVNRIGQPPFAPFTPDEMDRAALFAEAVASLVEAHESVSLIEKLFEHLMKQQNLTDVQEVHDWIKNLRSTSGHLEMLDLAVLVRELASQGDAERQLCREILQSITKHSRMLKNESFLSY